MRAAMAIGIVCVAAVAWGDAVMPAKIGGATTLPEGNGYAGRVTLPTNGVERVQCWAQTKSGTRCKRRAAPGGRYCRPHAAELAPKSAPEKCRSFTEDGRPCAAKPVERRNYCEKHLK